VSGWNQRFAKPPYGGFPYRGFESLRLRQRGRFGPLWQDGAAPPLTANIFRL